MARGAVPKINEAMCDEIIKRFKEPTTDGIVCDHVGITTTTLWRYKQKGEQDILDGKDTIYSKLCKGIKKGRSEAADFCKDAILKAMPDNWQASAWWLERTRPKEFGRFARTEPFELKGDTHDEKISSIIDAISTSNLTIEEGAKLADLLQKERELLCIEELEKKVLAKIGDKIDKIGDNK